MLVRLKEEEAVFLAKPGSTEEVLCRGVAGALMLPPPWASARSVDRHIFSSGAALVFITGFRTDGFLCKSWFWSRPAAGAPGTFWSFGSLGSLLTLDRRDDGTVAGLSPRRMEALLGLVGGVEPRPLEGGISGRLTRDGAPRLGLEMGTTRLRPCCSEWVRVRTDLPAGEELVGGAGLEEEAAFLFSLAVFFFLVSSGTSLC